MLRRDVIGLPAMVAVRWRASLQLRVVSTTLVLSTLVIGILGFFVVQQVWQGLQSAKLTATQGQATEGLLMAEKHSAAFHPPGSGASGLMCSIARQLDGANPGSADFAVAVLPPAGDTGPSVFSKGCEPARWQRSASIPARLRRQVEDASSGSMFRTIATLPFRVGSDWRPAPGLLYGARFGAGYQLYYFFPLSAEQQTIGLVQEALVFGGLGLVVLLAGIAWLLTRWVVAPVARAAQGARRLSTGNLDERLRVRGMDELAALATSFNEMAASLQDKMRELEELSQVQRQFVSDVSHELRTPLATIRMAADLLFDTREQMSSAGSRSAELLQSQIERFEALLTDLLEISRYDANAATLDAEPADVCDVIRHSADVAQQLAERRGTRIEFRLPSEPCVAEVDRRRLERIMRNLLVNAVEHGEGRDVTVTAASDRDSVAVAVRDLGVGLAEGEAQLVFDRFWRADPARARTTGGTGLGLSIALEDARLHGGWLEAWGKPGRGSVFRLTLPRTVGAQLAGSPLPLDPEQPGAGELAFPVPAAPEPVADPGLRLPREVLRGGAYD